ncbi:D-alanyl-D-alanine carboxypeptidase/D-alanyl-D-alanine endopeptidase [Petropleomorpha daqingensis]|uniref:D-alanyl-D-alanine carboxypeptidase/D-alanyl-D-alanine-endopeptidase (Penicillin-binding protein 4) n=1 Tax=Petropleomorpha daqingensis TaxID=2026353 RepID=A0A853CFV7_9ACTN|nr:D-alanyl-D-alanine carboxypeptidase/D-alanyl-D-alanine-endopeptidase [Petropleomorpha daqingensis]NYJ06061.1 D-alanyl-D-alanine carboxypeptidase/D-alanyl-D-alanine-endopeptidase (penicillin-binding protein 4) [Petropleomorpha daqingensis]
MVLLAVLVVVLVVGGVATLFIVSRDDAATPEVAAAASASLPNLGSPTPVLAALSSDAPAPAPDALAAELTPLLASPALGTGVSAEVVDVATGNSLFDQDGAAPSTPASTAKLLTSVAVLTTLDPSDTLETKVVAGTDPGQVVLVGGGDPTLSTTSPSRTYPGAPTMADLATQVLAAVPAGTAITSVVVDNSLYTGPLTASGWGAGDAPSSYAAPVTATAVDGARVTPGADARSGQPGIDAGAALADALGAPGAAITLGTAPAGAKTLGTVHSAPIARLVEQALSQSDNMLAEALSRQVAIARNLPASFEGSAQGVIAALKAAGVDTSGVQLFDGSGLSQSDRVPVTLLTKLITDAADGTLPEAAPILSGLAVAGYDGTLADRGDDDPATAPGAVRAKTGTLLGVNGLAGTVVTEDGRLLAFAILADDATGSVAGAESALDEVATTLAECGCR